LREFVIFCGLSDFLSTEMQCNEFDSPCHFAPSLGRTLYLMRMFVVELTGSIVWR